MMIGKTIPVLSLLAVLAPFRAMAVDGESHEVAHAKVNVAEVQFAICDETPSSIQSKLSAQSTDFEVRDVYFLETPKRDLQNLGFVARFRETSKGIKSSLKRNFDGINVVPEAVASQMGAKCELDTYLTRSKVGCSVKTDNVDLGDFSKKQRHFLEAAGMDPSSLTKNHLVGPVRNETYDLIIQDKPYTMDVVRLPTGDLIEVSFRTPLAKATVELQKAARMLAEAKVTLCPVQMGVTKKILDHYLGAPHN